MTVQALELIELYGQAIQFKEIAPQNWIMPQQLIVVQDPETDCLGFCSLIDGALNVHLGIEGLKGYLETLQLANQEELESQLLLRRTALSLSFEDIQDLELEDFKQMEKINFNILGSAEWPQFRNHTAGFLPEPVRNGWECRFLTQAIEQVSFIAQEMARNPQALILQDDEVILRVHTHDGEWTSLKVSFSTFLEQINTETIQYENDLEAYRVQKLPTLNMTFEVAQFLMPTPVQKNKDSRKFFPRVTAILESNSKQLVFAEITDPSSESQKTILKKFATTLLKDLQFKPMKLITDNEEVERTFRDFCSKTHLTLERVPVLESAGSFIKDLLNIEDEEQLEAMTFNNEADAQVDAILHTAQEICKTILNSNLLSSTLAEEAKRQFTSVVELIHVVMLGNFKELPDGWTANNMEIACTSILPTLLSEEELKYVPDILDNYVDIVGEAEMLPNYTEIKQRLKLIFS